MMTHTMSNLFNAELSLERWWWELMSREVGEEGDCT